MLEIKEYYYLFLPIFFLKEYISFKIENETFKLDLYNL